MDYRFHWRPVLKALPDLLSAAGLTLQVAVLAMALGVALGVVLALARTSGRRALVAAAVSWIELARNTPALFQIYFMYFGLGAFGLHLGSYLAVLAALSFNNAGYLAETFRGGFNAVPATQMRAARSLGMTRAQAYLRIVLPQVFRIVYPPLTNQMNWSILMSSLGMLVGLRELSGETQYHYSLTFRAFEFFMAAGVIYYVVSKLVMGGSRLIGWRLFRY